MRSGGRFLVGLFGTLPLGCVVGSYEPSLQEGVSVGGSTGAATVGGAANTGGTSGALGSSTTGTSTGTAVTVGGSSNTGGTLNGAVGGSSGANSTLNVGGANGGATTGSGPAGGAAVGGATNTGGAATMGGTQNLGGTESTSTQAIGGAEPAGGNTASGGASQIAGAPATGGSITAGGTAAVGGTTPTGASGGTESTTGGAETIGGALATGGVPGDTGGAGAIIGGAPPVTGGAPPVTGGSMASGGTVTGGAATGGMPNTGGVPPTGGTSSVPPPPVAVGVATGDRHSCALLDNDTVWCWGSNSQGQLGVAPGSLTRSAEPLRVPLDRLPAKITALTAGGEHTCALLANGTALCWGSNKYGQLGDGSNGDVGKPSPVLARAGAELTGIVAIDAGYAFTCALVKDTNGGQIAKCWGYGEDGELGNGRAGADYYEAFPVTVLTNAATMTPLENVRQLSTGYFHACATDDERMTFCWGHNLFGQLGDGTTKGSTVAQHVSDGDGNKFLSEQVEASNNLTCSMLNGLVACWGANTYGQLGAGVTEEFATTPIPTKQNERAVRLSVGYNLGCIVNGSGAVECWGDGQWGQLGLDVSKYPCLGSSLTCSEVPIIVQFPYESADNQIAVGGGVTSVLNAKQAIHSIGYNVDGNLGTGEVFSYSERPLEIRYSWR